MVSPIDLITSETMQSIHQKQTLPVTDVDQSHFGWTTVNSAELSFLDEMHWLDDGLQKPTLQDTQQVGIREQTGS